MRMRYHLQWPWARSPRSPRRQPTGALRQTSLLPLPCCQVSRDTEILCSFPSQSPWPAPPHTPPQLALVTPFLWALGTQGGHLLLYPDAPSLGFFFSKDSSSQPETSLLGSPAPPSSDPDPGPRALLAARQREYKVAALNAKRAGDLDRARELMRIGKV